VGPLTRVSTGHGQIAIVQEGAAEPYALLGLLRLVDHLHKERGNVPTALIVDSGTGATATGNPGQFLSVMHIPFS
jgi:hypothetical protein